MRYSSVFCLAGAFQLEHQAFAQIARADAGRVKGLDDLQHRLESCRRARSVEAASSSTVAFR